MGEMGTLGMNKINRLNAKATIIKSMYDAKIFWKPSKLCNVGIHRKALTEYFLMSTHVPGLRSF